MGTTPSVANTQGTTPAVQPPTTAPSQPQAQPTTPTPTEPVAALPTAPAGETLVFEDDMGFDAAEFVENPEPRCPVVLLVDTSDSMQGDPIRELNDGITLFRESLCSDELSGKRVEVAMVAFGSNSYESDFQAPEEFSAPTLQAGGNAPLAEAIDRALEMVHERKETYKKAGVAHYRPWVFLISKGAPSGDLQAAASKIRMGETQGAFAFFSVGIQGADMATLTALSTREPLELKDLCFRELFSWLSTSLQAVSHSQMGSKVGLPNPMSWVAPKKP